MRRLLLALGASVFALLVAEGLLSLAGGPSLRTLVGAARRAPPAEAPAQGLYRPATDPRVGYVLRRGPGLAIHDGTIHADELGLRARPGPPPPAGALRVVVLGDSVAFGYGLNDDQTLAAQLEAELHRVLAPGARPVACFTVAMPGWNFDNAFHALRDHLDELAPDVVLYLPVVNDLDDGDVVDAGGMRRWWPDAASPDPWLAAGQGSPGHRFAENAAEVAQQRGSFERLGPDALSCDLSPFSSARYDADADGLLWLEGKLAARGCRLMLLQWKEEGFAWHLRRRLAARGSQAPVLPLFRDVPASLTLGFDPHPNADATLAMARWIAADLLERGWIAGAAPGDVAAAPPAAQAARGGRFTAAQVDGLSATLRLRAWERLRPRIDFETLEGAAQVGAGPNADGSVGVHALFVLRRAGPQLGVTLAPVPGPRDLYPLVVRVSVDGRAAGEIVVPAGGPASGSFAVPELGPGGTREEPVEVLLAPQDAVVVARESGPQLEAFRPVALECH
jgi:hypothetical protein